VLFLKIGITLWSLSGTPLLSQTTAFKMEDDSGYRSMLNIQCILNIPLNHYRITIIIDVQTQI